MVLGPYMLLVFLRRSFSPSLVLFMFLGRVVEAQNGDFTIVVLPDTQYYSGSYPAILNLQMQWIVNNAAPLNIQLVLGSETSSTTVEVRHNGQPPTVHTRNSTLRTSDTLPHWAITTTTLTIQPDERRRR